MQIQETGNTRIVIIGDPGAGKTTVVKRMCYVWAQSVLHPDHKSAEPEYLQKYTLVIPIILRFITEQNSLMNIFDSQLKCLTVCEKYSLVKQCEQHPKKVLLLIDGFDEYTGRSIVEKVITKENIPLVTCITTSRPYAIKGLRKNTSQAVEHIVELCGFSKEQIEQYINEFCKYRNISQQQADELIRTLREERKDLFEIATIPIRTEMICIVWAVHGKLGETLSDLYDLFVVHLITHLELKTEDKSSVEPGLVLEKNKKLLTLVGKVANTWEKYGRLQIVFNAVELESTLTQIETTEMTATGHYFNLVLKVGLLTKSHPSHTLDNSKFSFPHLTIQEYFVAYFIGNTEDNHCIDDFASLCKNYRILLRCQVIFMFLCSKFPLVANRIFTHLVKEETNEKQCTQLLTFMIEQFKHFKNNTYDSPLPKYIDIKHFESVTEGKIQLKKTVHSMLESEWRQDKQSLHDLSMCNISQYQAFMELLRVHSLDVIVDNQDDLVMLGEKIQNMKQLENISMEIKPPTDFITTTDIVSRISGENLKYLSLTGIHAIKAVSEHIQRFPLLHNLNIDDESTIYTEETRQKFMTSVRNTSSIKQVRLCLPDLNDMFIQENSDVRLYLTVRKLQSRTLKNSLTYPGGIYKLDLSGNNLENEGESLGYLLAKLALLGVLSAQQSNLRAHTLKTIVQTFTKSQGTSGLHTIDMGGSKHTNNNNLAAGGTSLAMLIALAPNMENLDLSDCNLSATDLAAMSASVAATTRIQTLNLRNNNLGDTYNSLDGLLSKHLKALAVGGNKVPDVIPSLCRAAANGSLANVHILDIYNSQIQPGSLELFGKQLRDMKNLEALNLKWIKGINADECKHVYRNIQSSVHHVNIWTKHITMEPDIIINNVRYLTHLNNLNVRLSDSNIEMLQEELEKHNPQIQVYSEGKEDIWRIYVLDKID